jgi:hypothetical protein
MSLIDIANSLAPLLRVGVEASRASSAWAAVVHPSFKIRMPRHRHAQPAIRCSRSTPDECCGADSGADTRGLRGEAWTAMIKW